jgi:hypothetical protein
VINHDPCLECAQLAELRREALGCVHEEDGLLILEMSFANTAEALRSLLAGEQKLVSVDILEHRKRPPWCLLRRRQEGDTSGHQFLIRLLYIAAREDSVERRSRLQTVIEHEQHEPGIR